MAKNSFTLFKRLVVSGILTVGLVPEIAHAKWIKTSIFGSSGSQPVQLDFVLWNFNASTPNVWNQTGPLYGSGYGPAPLYGYGTGVSNSSTPTLQGPFVPQYTPGGTFGNTFALKSNGTDFVIDLTSSGTIPYLVKGFGTGAGTLGVKALQITGNLTGFSSTSTPNVVDFLSTAINSNGPSYACGSSCVGQIVFSDESVFKFTWTNSQFDEIESVPTPLPIFGALSAFSFSRKLRKRINIQKIETFS